MNTDCDRWTNAISGSEPARGSLSGASCLAHLLRRCRTLIRDHREHRFAPQVQRILQHALHVRDRYQQGRMSAPGLAIARGHLENQLNALIDHAGPIRVARRFAHMKL